MDCRDIERLLAEYLGDELDDSGRARVSDHLRQCAACREEFESLERVVGELRSAPDLSAAQAAVAASRLEVRRRPAGVLRWASSALRYAAVLAVGVGVGWMFKAPPPPASMDEAPAPPQVVAAFPRDIHPGWVQAARTASRAGHGSALGRTLSALSAAQSPGK